MGSLPYGWVVYTDSAAMGIGALSGFFGRAYMNEADHAIVIACRGTFVPKDPADLVTDAGMALCMVVKQLPDLIDFVDQIKKYQDHNGRDYSFTGHSLGASLAELGSAKFHYKATTFDSPGVRDVIRTSMGELTPLFAQTVCEDVLRVFEIFNSIYEGMSLHSILTRVGYHFIADDLAYADANITTYNAAPNLFNSMAPHVGKIFRLYPKVDELSKMYDDVNALWVGQPNYPFYTFHYTLGQHKITNIRKEFDSNTGYPKTHGIYSEWPSGIFKGYIGYDHYKSYDANTYYWDSYIKSIDKMTKFIVSYIIL